MSKLTVIYLVCQFLYVLLVTWKAIVTIKGGKMYAAVANAVTFGWYTIVLILTANAEIDMGMKIAINAATNFIGVYLVKMREEKTTPEKLWKIELAIPVKNSDDVYYALKREGISFNYADCGDWTTFNCYCNSSLDTTKVKEIGLVHNGKMSAYISTAM